MLRKDLSLEVKAVGDDGTFQGFLSVYDVIDLGNDVVKKGAFTKTIQDNKGKVTMLWQHKSDQPIGTLELTDTEAGLEVKGTFLLEVKQAREAYALVKAGVIRGLSIGYDAVQKNIKDGIRFLTEIKLWEGSVVTFPMLPIAQISSVKEMKDTFAETLDEMQTYMMRGMMVDALCCTLCDVIWDSHSNDEQKIAASDDAIQQFHDSYITFLPKLFAAMANYKSLGKELPAFTAETKAGRRNSASDEAMLRQMHQMISALLGEEAAESTSETEAGKSTSEVGAATPSAEDFSVFSESFKELFQWTPSTIQN